MNGNQIGGTIVWNLDVDDSKFKAGLDKARSQAKSVSDDVDKEFSSLGDRINKSFQNAAEGSKIFATGLLAVGSATAVAAGFGIKYAADLETMRQGFVTLLGSTEKANAAIAQIQKDAATTPFEFKGLVQANQLLTSVTKDAGKSEALLLNVGKALTAMGKGQPELDRIIVNLQQIGAVGKASAIDIKQFAFAGIPIYDLLRDHIKGTGIALDDFISDGKVTFELLTKLFKDAGEGSGRFAKAFETQGGTLNQVFSNLKDNLGITASQLVLQTGLFDAVKTAIKGLTDQLTYLASPAGIKAVISLFDAIKANAPIIIGLVAGGLAPAFYAWAGGIIAAITPLLPFLAIGAAVGVAVKLLIDAFGGWDKTMQAIRSGLSAFGKAFDTYIKPSLDALIHEIKQNLLPALSELWQTIKPILVPALKLLGTVIGGAIILRIRLFVEELRVIVAVVSFVVNSITGLIKFFTALPKAISDFVDQTKTNISILGTAIVSGLQNAVTSFVTFVSGIPAVVGSLIDTIVSFFVALPGRIATFLIDTGLKFVEFLGFITGLVIYGVPVLVNNIVTFFKELPGKLLAIWTQVSTDVVTFFTNIWTWLSTTVPQIIDSVVTFFSQLPGRIWTFLVGAYNNVISAFTAIWNWLSNIVPQIIETVVSFFAQLPGKIATWLGATKDKTQTGFIDIWNAIVAEVSTWPGKLYSWGANIANSFVDGIKSAIGHIVDAFKDGLNKAKALVEGNSPPIAGPFKDIDQWGFNVGTAWVDGVRKAIGDMSIGSPFNTPAPALAPAQGGGSSVGRPNPVINIGQMNVRDESDITDIARELGFRIELSPGYTQNG